MDNNGVWVTEAEILGAASLFSVDIAVFSKCGGSIMWLRYPATFNLDEKTEYCILLRNVDEHFEPVIKCMKGIL